MAVTDGVMVAAAVNGAGVTAVNGAGVTAVNGAAVAAVDWAGVAAVDWAGVAAVDWAGVTAVNGAGAATVDCTGAAAVNWTGAAGAAAAAGDAVAVETVTARLCRFKICFSISSLAAASSVYFRRAARMAFDFISAYSTDPG